MPKQIKICRVCGAKYEACNSARTGSSIFNWREVACSPECGMVYLNKITASRSIVEPEGEVVVMSPLRDEMIREPEHELGQTVWSEEIPSDEEAPEFEDIEVTR